MEATTVAATKKVNCKIYYSRVPNFPVHLEEEFHGERIPGKTFVGVYSLYFRKGKLEVSSLHEIVQLDGMIKAGSPLIYSNNEWILRDANDEVLKVQLTPTQSYAGLNNEIRNTGAGGAINSGTTLIVETNGKSEAQRQIQQQVRTVAPVGDTVQEVHQISDEEHINGVGTMPVESATAVLPVDAAAALRAGIKAAAAGTAASNAKNPAVAEAIAKLNSRLEQ